MKVEIPYSWADKQTECALMGLQFPWQGKKLEVAIRFGIESEEAVQTDINQVTIPEIISWEITELADKHQVRDEAALLQAFQTYRLSLYDIIDDRHMEKCGKPTFLKLYGEDRVKILKGKYDSIVFFLADKLEKFGVVDARQYAFRQYQKTVDADKVRNQFDSDMPTPDQAIVILEALAGTPARYIAKLAQANRYEVLAFSIANSMASLEDLIDFVSLEDFSRIKATIPFSFLKRELGNIPQSVDMSHIVRNTSVIKDSKRYTLFQLQMAESNLGVDKNRSKLFALMIDGMKSFLKVFPEDYFK